MGTALEIVTQMIEEDHARMTSYCKGKLRSIQDAEDAVNEIAIKALAYVKRHPEFKANKWQAWYWEIARNHMRDIFREREVDYQRLPRTGFYINEISIEPDYVEYLHRDEISQTVRHLIDTYLTEKQKAYINLIYYENLLHSEAGEVMHPESPVAQRRSRVTQSLRRAKQRLRELITERGYLPEFT